MFPGAFDITSKEIMLAGLYLFPVLLVAWSEGGMPALLVAVFSASAWGISVLMVGHVYSNFLYFVWNTIMVLGTFLIVAYSLAAVKKMLIIKQH